MYLQVPCQEVCVGFSDSISHLSDLGYFCYTVVLELIRHNHVVETIRGQITVGFETPITIISTYILLSENSVNTNSVKSFKYQSNNEQSDKV